MKGAGRRAQGAELRAQGAVLRAQGAVRRVKRYGEETEVLLSETQ